MTAADPAEVHIVRAIETARRLQAREDEVALPRPAWWALLAVVLAGLGVADLVAVHRQAQDRAGDRQHDAGAQRRPARLGRSARRRRDLGGSAFVVRQMVDGPGASRSCSSPRTADLRRR